MNGVKFLLDTNMILGLLKATDTAITLAETEQLNLNQSAVSQITRIELLGYPKISDHDEQMIHAFLAECQVLLLTQEIETEVIKMRRLCRLKLPDAIVAATSIVHHLRLLTLDQGMINGVKNYQEQIRQS
jgi:predicted nucleic acid-binding protein